MAWTPQSSAATPEESPDAAALAEVALRSRGHTAPTNVASVPSVVASVLLHAALLVAAFLMLRGRTTPAERTIEFEVGVIAEPATDAASPDAATRKTETANLRSMTALRDITDPASASPGTPVPPIVAGTIGPIGGAGTLASRSDIIGAGSGGGGAANGGTPAPQRELASGGAVGCLWGVGAGQQASSYVYVLDRSGSMHDTFHLLQRELLRAIGSLHDHQSFDVVWFSEGPAQSLSPTLLPATAENKRRAFDAIRAMSPGGRTQPLDALRQGLSLRADVLFLLSDGDFGEQNAQVLEAVHQHRARAVSPIVHTILFAFDGGENANPILRRIAEVGGGTYKHIAESRANE